MHAGLLPRLARELPTSSRCGPGRTRCSALAAAAGAARALATATRCGAHRRERATARLVLVVDQLEELVTLCARPRRAARVRRGARGGRASGPERAGARGRVLRDDFATVIEARTRCAARFEVFVLATPSPEALRRIVVEPARRARRDDRRARRRRRWSPRSPGGRRRCRSCRSRRPAVADARPHGATDHSRRVRALGGVGRRARDVRRSIYGEPRPRDQDIGARCCSRACRRRWHARPVRRAPSSSSCPARRACSRTCSMRASWSCARTPALRDVVEIVHECLAERWPRLARWRSEDAADRALLADVRAAARRWHDSARAADLLWRGQALAELRAARGALDRAHRRSSARSPPRRRPRGARAPESAAAWSPPRWPRSPRSRA